MQLYSPWVLLLLLGLPVLGYQMLRSKRTAAVRFPSLRDMTNCHISWRVRFRPLLVLVRLVCIGLLIVAFARPRKGTVLSEISTEGVAIETVVDHSGSMQTEMDYYGQKMNRLEVVKKVLAEFIEGGKDGFKGRSSDLIGLISFARYADTICPLVHSHNVLVEFLNKTEIVSMRSEDGTAIGDAIALAAARLQKAEEEIEQRKRRLASSGENISEDSESGFKIKSKVIVLLTDGINNAGEYDPYKAAELAGKWGIKIYAIGIGSGQAYTTIQTPLGMYRMPTDQNLDEELLRTIANDTGGFYSRADDADALKSIVEKIDQLEKTEVKSVQYTQFAERFGPWTFGALVLLMLEILASSTIFRKIP